MGKLLDRLDQFFNGRKISTEEKYRIADLQRQAFEEVANPQNNYDFKIMAKVVDNLTWLESLEFRQCAGIVRDKNMITSLQFLHRRYQKNQQHIQEKLIELGYSEDIAAIILRLPSELLKTAAIYKWGEVISLLKVNNDLLCKIIEDEDFNFVTTFYYGIEQNTKAILAEKLIV